MAGILRERESYSGAAGGDCGDGLPQDAALLKISRLELFPFCCHPGAGSASGRDSENGSGGLWHKMFLRLAGRGEGGEISWESGALRAEIWGFGNGAMLCAGSKEWPAGNGR